MSRCLRLLVLLPGLWLLAPSDAAGQPTGKPFRQGSHALRALLKEGGSLAKKLGQKDKFELVPLRSESDLDTVPADRTLIIVLGETAPVFQLDRRATRLVEFLKNGGALLVASDQRSDRALEGIFRVRVDGRLYVYGPDLEHRAYRQLGDCPFVERRAKHPIFAAVNQLATNRPSALEYVKGAPFRLDPLAYTSDDRLFAVGNDLAAGRLLILADHSVFINEMLLQDDNDNFQFAMNCVDWLTDEGRRNHVLLYEDGQIVTNFNVSFKPPGLPTAPQAFEKANQLLAGLQDENFFNETLLKLVGENDPELGQERLLRGLVLLLTLALAVYGLYRLLHARHRPDRQVPLLATTLALAPAGPAVDLRRREMLRHGNLWESARELARQCFPDGSGTLPAIASTGGWWQRGSLRRKAERLWRLAHAEEPRRVSAQALRQVAEEARQVRAALAEGRLRVR